MLINIRQDGVVKTDKVVASTVLMSVEADAYRLPSKQQSGC
jgi:hypothetical protein